MELQGKRVLVVGAGKSGVSVTRFLLRKGAEVTLTDSRTRDKFNGELDALLHAGVRGELGNYPEIGPGSFDLVVVSPGVPPGVPPVAAARRAGVPVTGELELAYRFARAPVVAITGTNGKTTTTALVGEIFRAAGYRTLVGGNIGLPLVDAVEEYGPGDVIVAEVSSFQLETADRFRPRVAVITNITPDHLDRHGDMECYTAAKARVFARQGRGDFTVLNYDDPRTRALAQTVPGKVIFFSRRHILKEGVFVRDSRIVARLDDGETGILAAGEVAIPGAHNLENALAATAAARVMGVEPAVIARTLKTFAGVAHRLETVAEINGVKYVNDSKGTNPEASMKALEAFDQPIILLAGGRNKGSDFTEFARLVREKVRVLVVLGESAGEIEQAARRAGCTEILRAPDFREAVLMAHRCARSGDVVLLSPACASWDMFKSYEERGDLFREIVNSLK
ncbi:UDP-N-acetylmuramoyl-L-alanine--D-glutamate ligase [Desulfallas sp. Bu1-1]|uniref:UDP-N-acetylmuramoyl-L-alanine--D-glutamate ligase n=1 Tax=Desulfallas sp. Bu1-1 TaxID=2787620 RepID=UPI00189D0C25|nr:UDP-N-acetylmuramoyl-L-alanine--D-glutamate ligase [Desulfallas sp. Bu1-1]MBF7083245.1 UDP-N-acetylmuramoyl-L-alanine--D-glutamate ligase [Desulfallas sp. Bu1-1]